MQTGSDLPDRRAGRTGGHAAAGRAAPAAEALDARLAACLSPTGFMSNCSAIPGESGQPEAERLTERGFVEMAYAMDLPLVATNDVYFPETKMYEAHDALICIAEGAYVDQQEPRRRLTRSITSSRSRRWWRCSPICPRRSRTPSRSRGAAPSRPIAAIRSCRNSPMTRSRSCAVRRMRGAASAGWR